MRKESFSLFNRIKWGINQDKTQQGDGGKIDSVQETIAFVINLVPEEGYGFLKTSDGREVYFNRNNVLHNDFDDLKIGLDVLYAEKKDREGSTGRTIQII